MVFEALEVARILIVDDEEANVRLLERLLRQAEGLELRSTTDPREVLGVFHDFGPDLVLLDLLMPHLDGYTVMEQLHQAVPVGTLLPILVLTADLTPEAKRRALSLGASDFLTKPFDVSEVLLRTRNLLEVRRLHQELLGQNERLEEKVRERTRELEESTESLRRTDSQRRDLLARLLVAQEDERRRLSASIQEEATQAMTAAGLRLHTLARVLTDPSQVQELSKADDAVGNAIARLRRLLVKLRPPVLDRDGLASAVRAYLEVLGEEADLDFGLQDRLADEPTPEIRSVLYRIAQEALDFLTQQGGVRRVDVVVGERESCFLVRVRGEGATLDTDVSNPSHPAHLVLASIRERAEIVGGWFRLDRPSGAAVALEVGVPSDAGPGDRKLEPDGRGGSLVGRTTRASGG